jgi:hypothetical protein
MHALILAAVLAQAPDPHANGKAAAEAWPLTIAFLKKQTQ